MSCNTLESAYSIARDSDWWDDIAVFIEDVAHPDNLAGYTAALWLEPAPISGNQTALMITTEDGSGYLALSGNRIEIRVPELVVNTVAIQQYLMSVQLTHPSGYKEPFLSLVTNVTPFGGAV